MKSKRQSSLNDVDREGLTILCEELMSEMGGNAVRALYRAHRRIRNKYGIKDFPVFSLYKIFMFSLLAGEYEGMNPNEIAKAEDICIKTAYNLKNEHWEITRKRKK